MAESANISNFNSLWENMNSSPNDNNTETVPTKTKTPKEKFIEAMIARGITDPRAQANILTQIEAESNFTPQSEKLNYNAKEILKLFPNKFNNLKDAESIVSKGKEALGNRIYGSRMGNSAKEGYKYRGRGFIQLTGKDNYKKYGKLIGKDLVNNPELANDPEIAREISLAYFQDKNIDLTNLGQVNKAIVYKKSASEDNRRLEIASKLYSEMGLKPIKGYTKKSNTKSTSNFTQNPSVSAPTVKYKPDTNQMKKSLREWESKEKIVTDSELYPQYNSAKAPKKKNPKILNNLYINPTRKANFGKLPKLKY